MKTKKKIIHLGFVLLTIVFLISCKSKKDDGLLFFLPPGGGDITNETASLPPESEVTTETGDEEGDLEFAYQTTRPIPVTVIVQDADGVQSGVTVLIKAGTETLTQGLTNSFGSFTSTFNLIDRYESITLQIIIGDNVVSTQIIQTANLVAINRTITISTSVDSVAQAAVDTDGDGVPDSQDAYPEDAALAQIITTPSSGTLIVGFEDLYPSPGDADFNDYVVMVKNNAEDLNAQGQVVRIRATYKHLAAGAGYKSRLKLNIPGHLSGQFTSQITDKDGTAVASLDTHMTDLSGISIYGDLNSKDTLDSAWNTRQGQTYVEGMQAQIEITFDTPASPQVIGAAPYDLYLSVLKYTDTEQVQVHFPGLYKDANGVDQYIDSKGFPWAIAIPEQWNWPVDGSNIKAAYPNFEAWYTSHMAGTPTNKDWYKQPDDSHLYVYFTIPSAIAAFFGQAGSVSFLLFFGLMLLAVVALFSIRLKTVSR
ncbi:MAG: LruC domain-containing protein [Leptospiraceae bacterium]|nr:LruC domain-containing protein [Leptospiraceae bacterium]